MNHASLTTDHLRVFLLGDFHIDQNEKSIHFPTRKIDSLFAYLITHPGEHNRGKLANLFWAESSHERASRSLRQAFTLIRKHIHKDILLPKSGAQAVVKPASSVSAVIAPVADEYLLRGIHSSILSDNLIRKQCTTMVYSNRPGRSQENPYHHRLIRDPDPYRPGSCHFHTRYSAGGC